MTVSKKVLCSKCKKNIARRAMCPRCGYMNILRCKDCKRSVEGCEECGTLLG